MTEILIGAKTVLTEPARSKGLEDVEVVEAETNMYGGTEYRVPLPEGANVASIVFVEPFITVQYWRAAGRKGGR